MKILIIGGSRFVGPYVIDLLLKHNHFLTVVNRGQISSAYNKKIKFIQKDRDKNLSIPGKFDAVIDTCAYTGQQIKKAIKELKFSYFLNFGTVAAYKKSEIFPLTEDFPIGKWPIWNSYNQGKVDCERILKTSKVKHSTIRPTYILGPNNYCDRENFIYSRIKHRQPLIIPGNGQALTQFIFAKDVAKIIVHLVEKKLTGAYNCAGDELISLKGLVGLMGKIVNKKPIIKYNPKTDGVAFKESEFPFANENFICSNQKIKNLGIKLTPLLTGLKKDYKNYYQKHI